MLSLIFAKARSYGSTLVLALLAAGVAALKYLSWQRERAIHRAERAEVALRRSQQTETDENDIDQATDTRSAEIAKKLELGEPIQFDPNEWDK